MLRVKTRGHHSLALVILGLDCKRILMAESPVYWQRISAHLSFPLSIEDFKKDFGFDTKLNSRFQPSRGCSVLGNCIIKHPELTDEYTF